jgi:hypothetical protein
MVNEFMAGVLTSEYAACKSHTMKRQTNYRHMRNTHTGQVMHTVADSFDTHTEAHTNCACTQKTQLCTCTQTHKQETAFPRKPIQTPYTHAHACTETHPLMHPQHTHTHTHTHTRTRKHGTLSHCPFSNQTLKVGYSQQRLINHNQ